MIKYEFLSNVAKKHKPTNVRRIPRERQVMQSNLGTVFQEEKQISLGW